jgi:Zn-dependent protease/predicted transcriptional regulator
MEERVACKEKPSMKSQIKIGTIFGVELGLHYSWFVIAVLIAFSLAAHFHAVNPYWSNATVWSAALITAVLFFVALILHELSHALVAKLRGLPVHHITLFMLGGAAQIEKEPTDASTEFWMAIVGPLTSFVLGFCLLAIAYASGWNQGMTPLTPGLAILVWLGYINILLGAFNLIPGYPLDGGRVFHAIVWGITKDAARSMRIAVRVGQAVAVLFIAYGIFEFFAGLVVSGIWLAFIGWFLLQAAGASYMQIQAAGLLNNVRVRDLMSTDCQQVSPESVLQDLVHEVLFRTGTRCFLVVDGGRFAGLVTPSEIRAVEPSRWPQTMVREVMRPASSVHSVSPDTPAIRALEIMARENINQLPVVSDGSVQGIISRGHLLQVLKTRAELSPPELKRAA